MAMPDFRPTTSWFLWNRDGDFKWRLQWQGLRKIGRTGRPIALHKKTSYNLLHIPPAGLTTLWGLFFVWYFVLHSFHKYGTIVLNIEPSFHIWGCSTPQKYWRKEKRTNLRGLMLLCSWWDLNPVNYSAFSRVSEPSCCISWCMASKNTVEKCQLSFALSFFSTSDRVSRYTLFMTYGVAQPPIFMV